MYSERDSIWKEELEQNGIFIENVCGTRKSGTFFLCLSKALIMFMVLIGTVIGFCDAFSMKYNKPVIIIYTLIASCLTAILFHRKKSIYVGLLVMFGLFIIALSKLSIYFSGGLRALSDIIRENYAIHYYQSLPKTPNPYYDNDYVSITVVLIFIIAILLILYNITIVRYMSFAETFVISFIILEIPMFIGKKPDLFPLMLVMAGCIAIGLIKHGSFGSINIPISKASDFIKERKRGKIRYTTVGNHKGIFMIVAFSVVFSASMLLFSIAAYTDSKQKSPESEIKMFFDRKAKIIAIEGVPGLFEKEAQPVFIGKGELGKLSKLESDNLTDIAVTFVPYSSQTIYLPGFNGVYYHNMQWYDSVKTADFPELGLDDTESIEPEIFDSFDNSFRSLATDSAASPVSRMQITYVDNKFDKDIFPYYKAGGEWVTKVYYQPQNDDKKGYDTRQTLFFIPEMLEYISLNNFNKSPLLGYRKGYLPELRDTVKKIPGTKKNMYGYEYLQSICLDVPDELDEYLEEFIREHDYFGIEEKAPDIQEDDFKDGVENSINTDVYLGDISEDDIDLTTITQSYLDEVHKRGRNVYFTDLANGYAYNIISCNQDGSYSLELRMSGADSIVGIVGVVGSRSGRDEETIEKYNKENEYRLQVCEAIKDMFLREYLYTLSPGRTPLTEDYVRYFLETQKQGVCTHFASAAVMILRHMGIPAKYVEGYCIPSSLVKEKGKKVNVDGDDWFKGANSYNPQKKAFTVEVSDMYAHAWIEVYLEGKGFVPFEVTPASYVMSPDDEKITDDDGPETKPADATPTPALNESTPTPTQEPAKVPDEEDGSKDDNEDKKSDIVDKTSETHTETDTERLLKMFFAAMCIGGFGWLLITLLKKTAERLKLAGDLKHGRFERLVYIRYCELVERLKKKKIVTAENPLPMELCDMIAEYVSEEEITKAGLSDKKDDIDKTVRKEKEEIYNRIYEAYSEVFKYMEKVLYSGYETNVKEYNDFYSKIQILK